MRHFSAECPQCFIDSQTCGSLLVGKSMNYFSGKCEDVASELKTIYGGKPFILKAPWSSSGKGLQICLEGELNSVASSWLSNVLKNQGGVVSDIFYPKQADFAMEFMLDAAGSCAFMGYSLFSADDRGRYLGNVIDRQDVLRSRLADLGLERSTGDYLSSYLCRYLSDTYGGVYHGIVGVDMLVAKDAGGLCIHPCLEMNFRCNMGVSALWVAERGVNNLSLTIDYLPLLKKIYNG
jgi:hypothetical protein